MYCIVTTNRYTEDEDFTVGDLVLPDLGDAPGVQVMLDTIRNIVE